MRASCCGAGRPPPSRWVREGRDCLGVGTAGVSFSGEAEMLFWDASMMLFWDASMMLFWDASMMLFWDASMMLFWDAGMMLFWDAGMTLWRRLPESSKWYSEYSGDYHLFGHVWEQDRLNKVARWPQWRGRVIVVPHQELTGPQGAMVRHLWGGITSEERDSVVYAALEEALGSLPQGQ
ncbi:unnamed protein product [Closterium sp. NIES-54]